MREDSLKARDPAAARDVNHWLPCLLQATDSLFPTGAYAHSGGLEALVQLGLVTDAPSLGAFLRAHALPALAHYELPYLGYALDRSQAGDAEGLVVLDGEYGAAKLPREAREASASLGSQRLRLLLRVLPQEKRKAGEAKAAATAREFEAAIARGDARGHAAIVCGLQAHLLGVPGEAAAAAFGYSFLAGFASAALKLIRIGQEGVQGALAESLLQLPDAMQAARSVEREDAGWADPVWEIAAAQHEHALARLFIS